MAVVSRTLPNILVTGTPGVGKTTLCEQLRDEFFNDVRKRSAGEDPPVATFEHLRIGEIIREHQLYTEWDDALNVPIFDEDMLIDHLEGIMKHPSGGKIVDFHSADFLPVSWFDLVIILRAETDILYDRLKARAYPEAKIQENVQSEIFQIVKDEVTAEFEGKVEIWEVPNNQLADLEALINRLLLVLRAQCSVDKLT